MKPIKESLSSTRLAAEIIHSLNSANEQIIDLEAKLKALKREREYLQRLKDSLPTQDGFEF